MPWGEADSFGSDRFLLEGALSGGLIRRVAAELARIETPASEGYRYDVRGEGARLMPALLTAQQVADEFGLPSVRTLRTMRARGLPAVPLGKAYLFDRADVERFIENAKVTTCPAQARGPYLNFVADRGRWYIQWSEAGRTRQLSTGTADRGAANLALAEFIQDRERSKRPAGPSDPSQFPIAEALSLYGSEHAPHAADPQRIGYAIKALVPYWGERLVGDITRETCRGYGRHRGKQPGTIRRELATLRAAINYAKDEGRITYAPTVHLPKKPEGKDRFLRRSEAAALLNAA